MSGDSKQLAEGGRQSEPGAVATGFFVFGILAASAVIFNTEIAEGAEELNSCWGIDGSHHSFIYRILADDRLHIAGCL